MEDAAAPRVRPRRLVIYYTILVAMVAIGTAFALAQGSKETAERDIAGGYDVDTPRRCLGDKINIAQSGRFVTLSNTGGTLGGSLTWKNERLTGTVSCIDAASASLSATVTDETLQGKLDGRDVVAHFESEPPAAGLPPPRAPNSVDGPFKVSPPSQCLGSSLSFSGSGSTTTVSAGEAGARRIEGEGRRRDEVLGTLDYDRKKGGRLTGRRPLDCIAGSEFGERASIAGTVNDRTIDLIVAPPSTNPRPGGKPPRGSEHVTATETRTLPKSVEAFFIAVVVVMLFARLVGSLMPRIGQPRVMGEVLAGIMLGPTVFGAIAPDLQTAIFPSDIIPYIGIAANLGLIFYMFLVGLELDLGQLRGRITQTLAISNTGVALPMVVGMLVAVPTYELVAPETKFTGFALFMGVSMSITAFPVLARIVVERRMIKRPLGVLALSSAAIDDVTAWVLIALASSIAVAGSSGSGSEVVETIALATLFCLLMGFVTRRLLSRAAVAFDEAGRVPGTWITAIFAGVLLSAFATESIGIALIFGAFVMGLVMPRHAGLTEDVTHRVEDFVVTLLLPLFFAFTGLRTDVLSLGRSELILLTIVLCAVAIFCKFGGTMIAARVMRMRWRESAVLATLMNTRGLTELIVLNLALEKGVISSALFSALVLMALLTTFMAGPLLRLLDPKGKFGAPVGEELEEAREETAAESVLPIPEHSILVAPQTDAAVEHLRSLAEPLARSEPLRELILARLVEPPRGASVRGGLQTETRILGEAADQLHRVRAELLAKGIVARAAVFTSTDPGRDLVRLTEREAVDLLLLDGRRPLLGGGVPRGQVGTVLDEAPCDVAVLVAREESLTLPGPKAPVVVPFGGAEHDWAALELGAWIASTNGAPLQLLGRGEPGAEGDDASRLLANASLLVQRFVGIAAEPRIAPPGREGVIEAAAGAALLVIGLAEQWRSEGLGATREAIARAAPAPILFVRRGVRPGALAPPDDVTRFSWSSTAISASPQA